MTRPRIAVVTMHFGELPYARHSAAINAQYCRRHGYDFHITAPDDPPLADRALIWYKVRRMADILPRCDFALWMDADAWFHDHDKRIEQLLDEHMPPECLFLIGTDRRDKDFSWSDQGTNVGVYVARNTPVAQAIFEEWWNVPIYDRRVAYAWPLDQLGWEWHIRPRWYDGGRIKVIDYHHLNGADGTFIRHLAGESNDRRSEVLGHVRAELAVDL
jgi:galactosyl transferase GMA12/MNN10 family